jgi:predicted transposase YbfD/YdcC
LVYTPPGQLRSKAKCLANYFRGHWSVQNHPHGQLDVSFPEDERRIRQSHGAENYSRLCRMALSMPTNEKGQETGIAIRRQNCGWDYDYLLKVLLA